MSIKMNRRDFLKVTGAVAVGTQLLSADNAFAAKGKSTGRNTTKLPQRTLGRTGESVSILGLGGAWFLGQSDDTDKCVEIINTAIDLGINYLDTAPNYQKSQERYGLVMAKRRKEVFLATKVEERTYDGVMKQVEESLKLLQTDHIDLVQVHYIGDKEDTSKLVLPTGPVKALEKLRDQKVIKYIGVSGHPEFTTVVSALRIYPWDTFLGFVNPESSTKPFFTDQYPIARKRNMGVIAMKVYGGGMPSKLVGPKDNQAPAPELLRWSMSCPAGNPVDVCLAAVSNVEQLKQNVEAAKSFTPMSEKQLTALEGRVNTVVDTKK